MKHDPLADLTGVFVEGWFESYGSDPCSWDALRKQVSSQSFAIDEGRSDCLKRQSRTPSLRQVGPFD
jgi:hypothetical protein